MRDNILSPEHERFARNCREARQRSGVTQSEVAERLGVNNTYVSKIERGLVYPRLERLVAYARAIGVPVVALWEGVDGA